MKKFIFLIFLSVLYAQEGVLISTATSEIKKFDVEVSTLQQRKKEGTSRTQIVEQKKAAPVILPPKEKKVSISVKPRFIGRLPLEYNSQEKIKGTVWRFSQAPQNIAGIVFSIKTPGDIKANVDIRAITNEEGQLDKYYTKWYYWSFSLHRASLQIPVSRGKITVFHNEKIFNFEKPIVNFTPLILFSPVRVSDWEEKFFPYENSIFYRAEEVPLGIGMQGIVFEYLKFFKFFVVDDNTTDEVSGLEVDPATGRLILDANNNSILDINEQDQAHQSIYGVRLKAGGKVTQFGFTATMRDVFRWENASLLDPWDTQNTKTNDELLEEAGISTATLVAERFARNLTGSCDVKLKLKKFLIKGEVSFNRILEEYVSKPVPTKIDALLYETQATSVQIPFNNGKKNGVAFAGEISWAGRTLALKTGTQIRKNSYDFDILTNPHDQNCPVKNVFTYSKIYFHKAGKRLTLKFAGNNFEVYQDTSAPKTSSELKESVFSTFFEFDTTKNTTFKLNFQIVKNLDSSIQSQLYPDFEFETASSHGTSILGGIGYEARISKIAKLSINYWQEHIRKAVEGEKPLRKILFEMRVGL